jgi:hypothetical protein
VAADLGRAEAGPRCGNGGMLARSEGGALQVEVGEVVLGLMGNAEAMATLIRRTLLRTCVPILRSLSRRCRRWR